MDANELRALADALHWVQYTADWQTCDRAADYLRAQADAQPVAWRCEVRGDGTRPALGASDWRHYATTTNERTAQAFLSRCGDGIEGRVVPLTAAPAAPQAEPIDPHMIVADDRFPDEQAEPKREPLSDDIISYEHACRSSYEPTCAASDFNSFKLGVRFAERAHGIGGSDAE